MTTRLMFVNAIDAERQEETQHVPLGFGYLASALRNAFGQTHFEFTVVDRDIESGIRSFKPDIVAITAVSSNFNRAGRYAKTAKMYGLPVIMGGVHISTLPVSLTDSMDVGVIGEGENTIVELLDIFERESGFHPDDLNQVPGIVFHRNGMKVISQPRNPIDPLDQIAMPARDLFRISVMTMMSSRGCPYKCRFCSASCMWGNIRYFSAGYVVNEIAHIVENYPVPYSFIRIWDDLFIADVQRLRQIIELLDEKQLLGTLRFWCHARSNLVTDEVAQLLALLGVKFVSMGLESGSPSVLQYYKGSTVSLRDNENAVKILKRHGISPEGSFIIGAPHETRKDVMQTYRFIRKHKLYPEMYLLTPYPGTPIWDFALQKGLVNDHMNWDILKTECMDTWKHAVILSEVLTREEICDLYSLFSKESERFKRQKKIARALKHPLQTTKALLKKRIRTFSQ